MAIRVVEFLSGGYKIRRKLLNFEFWINGELSKKGHNFSNKVIKKLILSKNVNKKKVLLIWYFSMKKKLRKIWMIFDIEN
jgi:hypothetical protein